MSIPGRVDNLLELLVPVLGLISAYLLLALFYEELSLPKLLSGTLALYLSLAAITGYYLPAFGLTLSTSNFIAVFSGIAVLVLAHMRLKGEEGVKPDSDALYILVFTGAVVLGLFYLVYPALPSLYPLSESGEALRHFSDSRYLLETRALPLGIYPLGMHLNLALISRAMGLPLIKALYPFAALSAALSAAVVFAMVVELTGNKRLSALFSAFFVLSSGYVNHALSISSSWEMLFGGFLALVMVWFLAEQAPARRSSLMIPAIIQGALVLSCASWALLGLLTFFTLQATREGTLKEKASGFFSFLVLAGLFALPFRGSLSKGVLECPQASTYIEDPLGATGVIFVFLALAGIPSVQKANRVLLAFLGATLALPLLMFLSSILGPESGYSAYYRSYFFLYYPMAIFATLGAQTLIDRWREVYVPLAGERWLALGMLLLLVLGGSGIVLAQASAGGRFRGTNVPLTPDEYRTASWIGDNVPAGEKLTFVNFGEGEVDWMLSISKHDADHGWRWVVIRDPGATYSNELDSFEHFYETGGIEVLKRRGT